MAKKEAVVFGECTDCGYEASSAEDFSDHAHACRKNPIAWKPTADYVARRAEQDAQKEVGRGY